MDFNKSKDNYLELINNSISYSGKDVDFFAKLKAGLLRQLIQKHLPNVKKPCVLDIGCGHGLLHKHFHYDDFEITGVDTAEEVLEMAKESNPSVQYYYYDDKTLPFKSEAFDVSVTICVMHHVPPEQWNAFLQEMKRVLKPGGLAIVFEHNPYNPVTRYIVNSNILDDGAVLISSHALKRLMRVIGFTSINNHFIFFTPFEVAFFRWLDKILWWCPLGTQYYSYAIR